jgi:hypothetical protein
MARDILHAACQQIEAPTIFDLGCHSYQAIALRYVRPVAPGDHGRKGAKTCLFGSKLADT